MIPEAQKKATHLKIGRLVLSNTSAAEQEEKIFEIVNQLNIGGKDSGQEVLTNVTSEAEYHNYGKRPASEIRA
ncbi:MAG: hypothetical protein V7L13_01160, partial [Nostoc sp.]|uniref:hypothetical protein n=1 Tax=Nostoc sp. TaxID=1180 RepID=UPI002FF55CAD